MGYTHYWYLDEHAVDLSQTAVDRLTMLCDAFYRDGVIQLEEDDIRPPTVCKNMVRFNGVGDDGHETFLWTPPCDGDAGRGWPFFQAGKVFGFCKTARKPYDVVVCVSLLVLKAEFGKKIVLSTDGEERDWEEAIELFKRYYACEPDVSELFRNDNEESAAPLLVPAAPAPAPAAAPRLLRLLPMLLLILVVPLLLVARA
jgi:hypothetical protein